MPDIKTIFHEQQEKAIDTLGEWSKWMMGVIFAAGTGCMVVLELGVSAAIKPYLVAAIFFLALSIFMCIFIYLTLPGIIEKLPTSSMTKKQSSIYDYVLAPNITLRSLIGVQLLLFILGIIFLLIWVILKPTH